LAACCLDGSIALWDVKRGVQIGSIDGRLDVQPGRKEGDARAAANQQGAQHFSSIAYSPDGELILAGGKSQYVCLYAARPTLLLRRFAVTHNRSLSGILQKLNSKGLGEGGVPLAFLDLDSKDEDAEDARRVPDESLPGVRKGDAASRRHAAADARVGRVAWAPTGSALGAATPEGLMLFGRDEGLVFDPFELGEEVTLDALETALTNGSFARALLLACHLGEQGLLERVLEGTPTGLIRLVGRALPLAFLDKVLSTVASKLEAGSPKASPHIEFYLTWLLALLTAHSGLYKSRPSMFAASLRAAHKALVGRRDSLVSLAEGNRHLLSFLAEGGGAAGLA
jgi:periodic tryptophan protein 2